VIYLLAAPLVVVCLWLIGFFLVTDFSTPLRDIAPFHRVLVIFPHADDEAVTCGGFLHRLSISGCAVTLVLLTKGERGTLDASLDESLRAIRVQEAKESAAILRISPLIQEDFGDGQLQSRKAELATFIEATIERERPDLIITYDLAGLYGHMDHVACSEVVSELHLNRFQAIPLWYVTFPKRVLERTTLPAHLAAIPDAHDRRTSATHKVFIGASVFAKIKAWYAYKSQRASLTEGIRSLLPIWFFLSMSLFEYFAEAS
jgi:LmbE family N-acetylglucosaminyl deacetylase